MEIDENTLKKIAEISRLKLSDSELSELRKDLASILEHFSELQEIKEDEELHYINNKPIELREDITEEFRNVDGIAALFNRKHERYLVAPKSLE